MSHSLDALAALPYRPATPDNLEVGIALIGCGGISKHHLQAYRNGGFRVLALCDLQLELAERMAAAYYPQAKVVSDFRSLLEDEQISVVDITTHPTERPPIIEAALLAGKHVMSQKPFVLDLDEGERLIALAERQQRYLAVNQNGRWAPHFSYARLVAQAGVLGQVFGAHLGCHWDHRWTAGTEFEKIRHLILYDYAIHWFDMVRVFFPGEATRVYASTARVPQQSMQPDLLAQATVEFAEGQASLSFDAAVPYGPLEETYLAGTEGSLHSCGTGNQDQTVTVTLESGTWRPALQGKWFPDGFQGTMSELLCAIEQGRRCVIDARDNLHSLALCFAALASADSGQPLTPGSVRRVPA